MIYNDINVKVIRKKIKNIYFRIDDEGSILVTCPNLIRDSEILKLLDKNQHSINNMLNKHYRKINDTNKVMYLGSELQFIEFNRIMLDSTRIYAKTIEEANKYLESLCLDIFQERMDIYKATYDNLPKFRLRVRKMKTRWGVCNKGSMTITLNTELIHKKIYLIDYVICHELAHFKYMDHSKNFWMEVGKHFPNYKEARKELRY